MKVGNEQEAIRVLIDECKEVKETIEVAVKFNINNESLWDQIILKTINDTSQLKQLLDYVDFCQKPAQIIEAFGNDVIVKDVRETLMLAFKKMTLYIKLLESALNVTEREKSLVIEENMAKSMQGFADIVNECNHCSQPLLP